MTNMTFVPYLDLPRRAFVSFIPFDILRRTPILLARKATITDYQLGTGSNSFDVVASYMASGTSSSWAPNTWFATNSTEQNGTFQVLATGTQDLAALVALFVTGSVERFAFDCNNGLLAAAVSPCSLLGILGYCQGLMKLGLGFELCESLGFKVDALRSHFGYLRSEVEYLPRSEYVAIHHLARSRGSVRVPEPPCPNPPPPDIWDGASIRWQTKRMTFHKNASWPLARGCWHKRKANGMGRGQRHAIVMYILRPTAVGVWFTISFYAVSAFLSSLLSSSIILFADHGWTWSRTIATFGLASGVGFSFLLWMVVYILEQIPRHPCEWFEASWCPWPDEKVKKELSLQAKLGAMRTSNFSFFKQAETFYLFTTSILTNSDIILVRLCSFALALLILLGYICQYIELRKISSQGAAVWLICQLSLAAVRVLVWNASARIHILNNQCLKDFTFYWPLDESLSSSSLDFEWSMTEIEIVCLAIDQRPLFPPDGGVTRWGHSSHEENEDSLPEYSLHWLMGHLYAMFEAPRHLLLPVLNCRTTRQHYQDSMRRLTTYSRRERCDPMVKLWLAHRCDGDLSELFHRWERPYFEIKPWLFIDTMPEFKIVFLLHTCVLHGKWHNDMSDVEEEVDAVFAVVSEDPDEVVVLLHHWGHHSPKTWLTRTVPRPQAISGCARCSEAAVKVFDPKQLERIMVEWNHFTAAVATWRLAKPHLPAVVDWTLKEVQTRWQACNADPSEWDRYYPYSWQEVMEWHGYVSNMRSFAHQSFLKKMQNALTEIGRQAAVRWKTVTLKARLSRNARRTASGNP